MFMYHDQSNYVLLIQHSQPFFSQRSHSPLRQDVYMRMYGSTILPWPFLPQWPQHVPSTRGRHSTHLTKGSDRLPTAVVDVGLELPADEARDAVAKPEIAQHGVVALLVEEKLTAVTQAEVHLAVLVDVGRLAEGARQAVDVEDAAFADVDKQANVALASLLAS